jgi:type IV pilus assembly protein PilP
MMALVSFLWAGCSGEQVTQVPPTPTKKASSAKSGGKIEVPSIFATQKDDYFYNPVGKRDPFKQFVGELVKDVSLPKAPLERYDLDELNLTAIVWGIADPRALLRAPDGYSYIVRTNTRVGKNRGRIAKITRRQVFVEEEYRDPTGKLVVRESTFEMTPKANKEQEEDQEKQGVQMKVSDE